eukprot:3350582-Rhodomonas_salina.1
MIRELTYEECEEQEVPFGCLVVREMKDGGSRNAVTKIGIDPSNSETEVFTPLLLEDHDLVVWDCPGFADTMGAEANIANAVNLSRLLSSSQQHGLAIMLVLDAPSLQAGRGELFKRSLKLLFELFGAEAGAVRDNLPSILFCVTKSVANGRPIARLGLIRKWVVGQLEVEGIRLTEKEKEQILVHDPLDRHPEGVKRDDLFELVQQLGSVKLDSKMFRTTLRPEDTLLLSKIAAVTVEDICHAMNQARFKEARKRFAKFRSLQVIAHPEISEHIAKIQHEIQAQVMGWAESVRALKRMFDEESRLAIRRHLSLLKGADGPDMAGMYNDVDSLKALAEDAEAEVRDEEAQLQLQECDKCAERFSMILEQCRQALQHLFSTRKDPASLVHAFGEEPVPLDAWKTALARLQSQEYGDQEVQAATKPVFLFLSSLDKQEQERASDTRFLFPCAERFGQLQQRCHAQAGTMVRKLSAQFLVASTKRLIRTGWQEFKDMATLNECEKGRRFRAVHALEQNRDGGLEIELAASVPHYTSLWTVLSSCLEILDADVTASIAEMKQQEAEVLANIESSVNEAMRLVLEKGHSWFRKQTTP